MAITYPLVAPAQLLVASVRFVPRSVVAASRSPFTGQEQVYVHQGQWWEMDVKVLPADRATMEYVIAFLIKLNGKEGTFLFGPPGGATPRGGALGSPAVASSSQSGNTFYTRGWTASQAAVLKAGDWVQTGSGSTAHLYKNLDDAGSNGSGEATLTIWPKIRATAPTIGAAIVVSSPSGIWRLASNEMTWDINDAVIYGLSFTCIEALNP